MEIFKKKILLENYIDRGTNSPTYGLVTATSFFVNVMLVQSIDDMGLYTDMTYLQNLNSSNTPVNYSPIIQKLSASGITFPFMQGISVPSQYFTSDYDIRNTGKTVSDYYNYTNTVITGVTDSKKEDVRSYKNSDPFRLGFDVNSGVYTNFKGDVVSGIDRVTQLGTAFTYVFGADKNDPNIGTRDQQNGLLYIDYSGGLVQTQVSFKGEGWNQTNTSLSAITKEEYLFGIVSKPEIESDLFIDRGITTVFDKHLRLSEITNLNELARYGKGYYNLISQ
jgi:hypothetical protein